MSDTSFKLTHDDDLKLQNQMNAAKNVFKNLLITNSFFAKYTTRVSYDCAFPDIELPRAHTFDNRFSRQQSLFIIGHIIVDNTAPQCREYPKCPNNNAYGKDLTARLNSNLTALLPNDDCEIMCVSLTPLIYGFYLYLPKAEALRYQYSQSEKVQQQLSTCRSRARKYVAAKSYISDKVGLLKNHIKNDDDVTTQYRNSFINNVSDICPLLITSENITDVTNKVNDFNKHNSSCDYFLQTQRHMRHSNDVIINMVLKTNKGLKTACLTTIDKPTTLSSNETNERKKLIRNIGQLLDESVLAMPDYSACKLSSPVTPANGSVIHGVTNVFSPQIFTKFNTSDCLLGTINTNDIDKLSRPHWDGDGNPLNHAAKKFNDTVQYILTKNKLNYEIKIYGCTDNTAEIHLHLFSHMFDYMQ